MQIVVYVVSAPTHSHAKSHYKRISRRVVGLIKAILGRDDRGGKLWVALLAKSENVNTGESSVNAHDKCASLWRSLFAKDISGHESWQSNNDFSWDYTMPSKMGIGFELLDSVDREGIW